MTEIWIDAENNLPVFVREDMDWPDNYVHTVLFTDLQYNIDFDPKLFDTSPPEGYKDRTKKTLALEDQVHEIVTARKAAPRQQADSTP